MDEMEINKEKMSSSTHISILPPETIGQVLQELSVVDRLQCEGVNRHWKLLVWDLGWTSQKKLSPEIVFQGANDRQKEKFKSESLIASLRRGGANLLELDLENFSFPLAIEVFRALDFLSSLGKLNFTGNDLSEAVEFLPSTLLELHSSGPFDDRTVTVLSAKCPNLQSIRFINSGENNKVSVSVMNSFLGKCPNLQTVHLEGDFIQSEQNVSLTALGQLQWLDELYLEDIEAFDNAALTALASGCPRLLTLEIIKIGVSEQALNKLDGHPTLLNFDLAEHPILNKTVKKEINGRWKIKKYKYLCSRAPTDDYFVEEALIEISCVRRVSPATLIRWGFLPLLIKSLGFKHVELQFQAARALTNIAANAGDQTDAVVEAGAVPELLKLLGSESEDIRAQSLLALADMIIFSVDTEEFREQCIRQFGLVERVLGMVETEKSTKIVRQIVRILDYCLCLPIILSADAIVPILSALGKFIQNNDDVEILFRTVRALSNVSVEENGRAHCERTIQLIVNLEGVVPRLVSLLSHLDEKIQLSALHAVGNIAYETEEHLQLVLDLGALKAMPALISHPNDEIVKYALLFLANAVYESDRHVQAVFDTGLVPVIIQILLHRPDLREVAAYGLSNLAENGQPEHVHFLVDHGVITLFCKFLDDETLASEILHGLMGILKKSGTRTEEVCAKIKHLNALDKIENLRNHQSEDISEIAKEIIDSFFPSSEGAGDENAE